MFSFAIWDSKEKHLFCARDRLGIKPFYYMFKDGVFYFASEVKSLLLASEGAPSPNPEAVYDYLSLGLMHHAENSFFAGIRQIAAGCYLEIDAGGLSTQGYWDLSTEKLVNQDVPDLEVLQDLIEDSVKLRLRSDVPVGILLSGGFDSSSITALAARNCENSLQTFSLEFDDATFDESIHAKLVASHCKATLHILKPEGQGLWQELDDLIKAQDGPTHAPEVYSNWCMMRAVARNNGKVLLSGQGGDELFAGYNWYPKYFLISLLRRLKLVTMLRELGELPKNFQSNNTKSRLRLLGSLFHGLLPIGIKLRLKPELGCISQILQTGYRKEMRDRDSSNLKMLDPPGLEEKMQNDLQICNIPHYLHYEDANSMAFSVEERVPFLDHRLVEWAHQLVVWWKIKGGHSKYILRSAMSETLPEQIIKRPDKMGLSAPRDQWLRGELHNQIKALFFDDCLIYEQWVDRKPFLVQLEAYMKGRPTSLSRLLWRCINLEKWLRCYT